jgi:hypothetical protein
MVLISIALIGALGCSQPDAPETDTWVAIGTWPVGLREWLRLDTGIWQWHWIDADHNHGSAQLVLDQRSYRWRLDRMPATGPVHLVAKSSSWLPVRVDQCEDLLSTPPLPRLQTDSDAYPDLVAMVRDLITPRFAGYVVHWPSRPIPVRAGVAQSGSIDLAACLREAVTLWNEGESPPLFVWNETASWGVRLAHYAGSLRRPPLQLHITRSDSLGRPLRARISVGDDYSGPHERIYAVRGLAHELGHALLLWGHSPDREHLLWGAAPPQRNSPSQDERRAAALLALLPSGLDLGRYGPVSGS